MVTIQQFTTSQTCNTTGRGRSLLSLPFLNRKFSLKNTSTLPYLRKTPVLLRAPSGLFAKLEKFCEVLASKDAKTARVIIPP